MPRLGEYLDPENIGGFLSETVQPWGEKLYDQYKDWEKLPLNDKLQAAGEAAGYTIEEMARMSASGFVGLSTLAHTGSLEEAVTMIKDAQQNLPAATQPESAGGRLAVETMGTLGEPLEAGALSLGEQTLEATGSPAAATGVYTMAGMIPGRRGTKRIKDAQGNMVPRPTKGVDVPDIRDLDVNQGIDVARYEPHLIGATAAGEGKYLGGPRDVKSAQGLTKMRGRLDEKISEGREAGDWYQRARGDIEEVTGGDPLQADWMAKQQAQFSAGVAPEIELGFSLKDTNSAIANAGKPNLAYLGDQRKASTEAIATNDPGKYRLGEKTGIYAGKINPNVTARTAVGVNDFRHARNLGYTEPTGLPQTSGMNPGEHRFMDYETALATDRANQGRLAGRENWTGEEIQAAPWVVQKSEALLKKSGPKYREKAKALQQQGRNEPIEMLERELAFKDANRTIGDFYGKHQAYATTEQQPFVKAGHLPRLADATLEERAMFANDPGSDWAFAPGGRDALYAGMKLQGPTGYGVRTRPTTEMQGVYDPPGDSPIEFNPGRVARPLVAFNRSKTDAKSIPQSDRAIMDVVEATRGAIDVQGAGAWHKVWKGGNVGEQRSVEIKRDNMPSNPAEIQMMRDLAKKHGFPDVVDTGEGFTLTSFMDQPLEFDKKQLDKLTAEIDQVLPGAETSRAKVESGYLAYEDAWTGGGVTERLLERIDASPIGVRQSIDNNPGVSEGALRRFERDERMQSKFGATRQDVQNMREVIGQGPGWVDRLRKALADGTVLPVLAAVALGELLTDQDQGALSDEVR